MTQVELAACENKIDACEKEIAACVASMEEELKKKDSSPTDLAYWRKEKEQLRNKEEQLRKEKEQLRDSIKSQPKGAREPQIQTTFSESVGDN